MTLREYLLEREQELLNEIKALHEQIAVLCAELVPKEGELAEVRRAKNAIGGGIAGLPFEQTTEMGTPADAVIRQSRANLVAPFIVASPGLIGGETAEHVPGSGLLTIGSPYEKLTMKELVIKALSEQFQHGATTRQLIEFFRDAWGRKIERTNLSPQLSRAFQDGVIGRIRSIRGWFLIPVDGIVEGFRPYLDRRRIIWKEPKTTTNYDEPLLTRDIDGANDRLPYGRTIATPLDRRVVLVWLLPHEVTIHDRKALRFEFPAPDDDDEPSADEVREAQGDLGALERLNEGLKSPENQAKLAALSKIDPKSVPQ